jgi:uncharacterized protein
MIRSPLAALLSAPIWIYRKLISPMKPATCRFHPTCSSYAMEALRIHGALRGAWLSARRICRCHPFCEAGWDPVPSNPNESTLTPPSQKDRQPGEQA